MGNYPTLFKKGPYVFDIFKRIYTTLPQRRDMIILATLRAAALISVKFSFYFILKAYFFYFTHLFLQNTHISLSILPSILFK